MFEKDQEYFHTSKPLFFKECTCKNLMDKFILSGSIQNLSL